MLRLQRHNFLDFRREKWASERSYSKPEQILVFITSLGCMLKPIFMATPCDICTLFTNHYLIFRELFLIFRVELDSKTRYYTVKYPIRDLHSHRCTYVLLDHSPT